MRNSILNCNLSINIYTRYNQKTNNYFKSNLNMNKKLLSQETKLFFFLSKKKKKQNFFYICDVITNKLISNMKGFRNYSIKKHITINIIHQHHTSK